MGAGVAWWQRGELLAWAYVRGLERAGDGDREAWIERVASLDYQAVPQLCGLLEKPAPAACAAARATLARLAERWPEGDPRGAGLRAQVTEKFSHLSLAGQRCVLELYGSWLDRPLSPTLIDEAIRLLQLAVRSPDKDVRCQALTLAGPIVNRSSSAEQLAACREFARTSLQDAEATNRLEAVRLAVHPKLGLSREVAPLLDDPAPAVRQMAMASVGDAEHADAVETDDLLRSLHDPDPDVRRLCEAALRSRRLSPNQIAMGRLLTDARPVNRLEILNRLPRTELEPGLWLRRLSQDTSPAVRAGAIRAATEYAEVDFTDRLEKMASDDPSPTVRQLADHYLKSQKERPKRPENR
jgi:hypothetical protein